MSNWRTVKELNYLFKKIIIKSIQSFSIFDDKTTN